MARSIFRVAKLCPVYHSQGGYLSLLTWGGFQGSPVRIAKPCQAYRSQGVMSVAPKAGGFKGISSLKSMSQDACD